MTFYFPLQTYWQTLRRKKFSVLLVYQLLFILVYPLVEGSVLEWGLHVVSTFVFITILGMCTQKPFYHRINHSLLWITVTIYLVDFLIYFTPIGGPRVVFQWVYDLFFIGLFLYMTLVYCLHMLTDKAPQIDTLAGVAAVYLMIGFTWSFAYMNLNDLQPGAFELANAATHFSYINWLFYSISTLVSSNYADVVPVSSYAKCITIIQSVIGALYIAIITARIVGVPFNQLVDDAP